MMVNEIFETFGIETKEAMVIDRVFIPNYVTVNELIAYSKQKRKPLNIVRRGKYISVVNPAGWVMKRYCDLSEKSRYLLVTALEKADTKNAGYWGQ